MTGIGADHIGGEVGLARLLPQGVDGEPVLVESWWTSGIPAEVQISTDAGERWLGCSTAVGGGGSTLVVVARDVTRARQVDRMKDDLISTVSHELRTPLATIRGFTALLGPPSDVPDDVRVQVLNRLRRRPPPPKPLR